MFLSFSGFRSQFVILRRQVVNSSPIRSPFYFGTIDLVRPQEMHTYNLNFEIYIYVCGAGFERRRVRENVQENVYRITEWNGADNLV